MRDQWSAQRCITQDITLLWHEGDARPAALDAQLGYRGDDPFAITLRFHGAEVVWTFGRELLRRGLTTPVGEGDVAVWPRLDAEGRAAVVIQLRSPDGEIHLQGRTIDVYRFVARTLDLVPSGSESDLLDLDDLVANLLREEP
ncbi:SsgA family sporulation/cell division regulator [Nocardioides pacificus]